MSDDYEQIAEFARQHVDRAVESTDRANPDHDVESVEDLYERVTGFEDMATYELELELHEFEMMQLMQGFMTGLDRMQNADELAFKSNMIAKLAAACPEHFERMEELQEEIDAKPRGFQ